MGVTGQSRWLNGRGSPAPGQSGSPGLAHSPEAVRESHDVKAASVRSVAELGKQDPSRPHRESKGC